MTTYKEAGVDIDMGTEAIVRIKEQVRTTFNANVLTDIGGFGGCFQFDKDQYDEPVLISSADGVGTKLKLAFLTNRHDTIGQCLVNHCANDILAVGARPLFFLDYFAAGKLDVDVFEEVVSGLAKACKENDCALIGGECAEMPDIYADGDFDIAGFAVGVVELERAIDPSRVEVGDVIIGLPASGVHSNGFTLARAAIADCDLQKKYLELSETKTLGEVLLEPTRIYVKPIVKLLSQYKVKKVISGMSHITGGGIAGNVCRSIGNDVDANIHLGRWK